MTLRVWHHRLGMHRIRADYWLLMGLLVTNIHASCMSEYTPNSILLAIPLLSNIAQVNLIHLENSTGNLEELQQRIPIFPLVFSHIKGGKMIPSSIVFLPRSLWRNHPMPLQTLPFQQPLWPLRRTGWLDKAPQTVPQLYLLKIEMSNISLIFLFELWALSPNGPVWTSNIPNFRLLVESCHPPS